jgi:CheY-like chemotaxis protein
MQKRILVAEDDTMQRHLITLLLGWHDYEVHTAEDGAEAVRMCLTGNFKLVLMDYKLPVMNGHSAARVIANFTRDTDGPAIVALTSLPERLREEELGASSVFAAIEEKPWDPKSLIETLDFFGNGPVAAPDRAAASPLHGSGHAGGRGGGRAGGAVPTAGLLVPDMRREIAFLSGQRPPGPSRILVAEDDELLCSLLTVALSARNYEVDSVSNGLDALIMLGQRPYDIALMDYRLPKLDGLIAAQLARDLLPKLQRPRLISLTSSPKLVRDEDEGPPFAFDAVISKTHDLQHILAAIDRSLSYSGLAAHAEAAP